MHERRIDEDIVVDVRDHAYARAALELYGRKRLAALERVEVDRIERAAVRHDDLFERRAILESAIVDVTDRRRKRHRHDLGVVAETVALYPYDGLAVVGARDDDVLGEVLGSHIRRRSDFVAVFTAGGEDKVVIRSRHRPLCLERQIAGHG